MLYNLTNEFILISESEGCIYNLGNSVIEINTTTDKNQGILLLPGENQSFTKTVYCRSVEAAGKIAVNEFLTEASGSGGGGEAVLTTTTVKSTTTSQTVTPESGYDGFSSVTVSPIDLETKTVKSTTTSQTITPTSGKDGISEVTVSPIVLQDKTVKSSSVSQTITADNGYDALNEITVSPLDLETKTVKSTTTQQTVTPTAGKDGISSITVEALDLETKNITENGTYTPTAGKDGFSSVNVNVGSVSLAATYRNKISISAAEMTELLDGATTIDTYMFYEDKNLVSIDIPEGVTSISGNAFSDCANLVHVGLPSTLTTIGAYAFRNCTSLVDMQLPASLRYPTTGNCFYLVPAIKELKFFAPNNGQLTISNQPITGAIYAKKWIFEEGITTLNFQNGETGASAYQYIPNEIIFPSTLTTITKFYLNIASKIQLLTIPDNVTTISTNAFNASNINAISLPANITSTAAPIFAPGIVQFAGIKEIYVRGNSSCSTATLLNNHTADQLYHAKITYLGE